MQPSARTAPVLIAVGGGKGGVGKSVFSVLLSQWMARFGRDTILVDLDLSGANLHTLLGIQDPSLTLYDLLSRKVDDLEEIALETAVDSLRVICGASEILTVANPVFAQKIKIMRKLSELRADYVVLDLGAGTSFDVLDFFLLADRQFIVSTPEPISIFNAYAFMRNAVYRRLSQLSRRNSMLKPLVQKALDPKNDLNLTTARALYDRIYQLGGTPLLKPIYSEMSRITPLVVINQIREARERNAFQVLQQVAEKYLMLRLESAGAVSFDPQLQSMVQKMIPLTEAGGYHGAWELVREMAARIAAPSTARGAASDSSLPAVRGAAETGTAPSSPT